MCTNQDCRRSSTCYRFLATPTAHRQAYSTFSHKDGFCPDYWPHTAFPVADQVETLKWIAVKRRDGDVGRIAEATLLNKGVISLYITKAGRAVLKPRVAEQIIHAFKKIYNDRI